VKTIFAESVEGRRAPGLALPVDDDAPRAAQMLPEALLRKSAPRLPQCSELDVVRHFTNLSKLNYSVDANFYPLGSCTMKYNPKFTEYVAALPGFARMHPLLAQLSGELAQGALQCLYDAERWLCEVTGMKAFTFQPMAGANGEYTGVKLIAAYHKAKGRNRTKMLIPDSAHGTNPASAVLAGFEIVNVPSRDGMVDPAALEEAMAKYPDQVAGLMMTNPNTLGLLELHLPRIVEVLRREDALLYYDGANMNAILGKMRVGDVGFDVVHLNVHKTLGTPHGRLRSRGCGRAPAALPARAACTQGRRQQLCSGLRSAAEHRPHRSFLRQLRRGAEGPGLHDASGRRGPDPRGRVRQPQCQLSAQEAGGRARCALRPHLRPRVRGLRSRRPACPGHRQGPAGPRFPCAHGLLPAHRP